MSGKNKKSRCIKQHKFKLFNASPEMLDLTDFRILGECKRCGRVITHKTIVRILNKYTGV